MPPLEPRLTVEIIAQALRRRRTRPVYELRADAELVLEGLREAGLAIVALPRPSGLPPAPARKGPPANAEQLARLIADAIGATIFAARWSPRAAAEAVLDSMREAGLRIKVDRGPRGRPGPRLVYSRAGQPDDH